MRRVIGVLLVLGGLLFAAGSLVALVDPVGTKYECGGIPSGTPPLRLSRKIQLRLLPVTAGTMRVGADPKDTALPREDEVPVAVLRPAPETPLAGAVPTRIRAIIVLHGVSRRVDVGLGTRNLAPTLGSVHYTGA